MTTLIYDLMREYFSIHAGTALSLRQVQVLLALYDNGDGIPLSRMSGLLRLPLAAAGSVVENLARIRLSSMRGEAFGLIRTEPASSSTDAVQVHLTREGHAFTGRMLRAITG